METPIEETLAFLDDAVRAGKIHYVGLSNFTGWELQLFVLDGKSYGCAGARDSATAIQPPLP